MKLINDAIRGIGLKLGISYVLGEIRAAAEGKRGETWLHRYTAAAAAAQYTGFVLGIAAIVAEWAGARDIAIGIVSAAGVLVTAGLLNSGWQTPTPKFVTESEPYVWLAHHSALLASACATVAGLFEVPGVCHYLDASRFPCATVQAWFGLVTLLLGSLKLLDASWRAAPPLVPLNVVITTAETGKVWDGGGWATTPAAARIGDHGPESGIPPKVAR